MSFDISRLRRADQVIGGGAIAFIVFMFLFKWYGVSFSGSASFAGLSLNHSANGWNTFTNSRWIWLLTIIVALGAVVLVAGQRELNSPVPVSVLVAGLGALSTILILYRIIHHPSAGVAVPGGSASAGIKIGIWLGLIAAAAITYGGYLGMQAEGTSLAGVRGQASEAFHSVTAPAGGSSGGSGGAPAGAGGSAPAAARPTPAPAAPQTPPAAPPPASPPPASSSPAAPPIPPPATGAPGGTPSQGA
jgi:hypothetical protein